MIIPQLTAVSAFAGIGGFDEGFRRAGIQTNVQIEWDKVCQQILQHHYPHAKLLGDISDVTASDIPGRPTIWTGGFPCQDTSIGAPHRLGLAGSRSSHFFEFARLIAEYQRLIAETDPEWVVIENPPGLLKSNTGRDLATVVRCLEELGYGWAYRVVDGRHFGSAGRRSPQRRQRVLVVGHRGGEPGPAWQVLGDREGRGETGASTGGGRRPLGLVPAGAGAFDAVWRKSARPRAALSKGGYETWVSDGLANTLTGFDFGGPTRQTHFIAQGGRLRTLTLTEWERLNLFPDDWTKVGGASDADRAVRIGNAMHVGMAEWLGRRIVTAHHSLRGIAA